VLGSGATLNFIDPKFFSKKITVCVNDVGEVYLPTTKYIVTKYHPESWWTIHISLTSVKKLVHFQSQYE
jgi:hypothetical protein